MGRRPRKGWEFRVGFRNDRKQFMGRADIFWRYRGKEFRGFEMDLAELEQIQGGDVALLNDSLNHKLNMVAAKHFKRGKPGKGRKKRKNKGWWNREVEEAVKSRKRANKEQKRVEKLVKRGEMEKEEHDRAWELYNVAKIMARAEINKAVGNFEKEKLDKVIQKGKGETKNWYKFIRGDKRGDFEYPKYIKVGGVKVENEVEIKEAIENFWKEIVGAVPTVMKQNIAEDIMRNREELNADMNRPSREEIREVTKGLKNEKGVGFDGIPYEFFKYGGTWAVEALYRLFGAVWETETIPGKWNESKVILLHKGQNKSKLELKNYRPISLANTGGKIFASIMSKRLSKEVEDKGVLGEEQNGFRRTRRGEDNIYVIRELIEKHKREGKKLFIAFLDIEKAYDNVNREILQVVLRKLGVPEKYRKLIKGMYTNTKVKYVFGNIETG